MDIYLVRHLQTKYSQLGIYMGRSFDLPILEDQIPFFQETVVRIFPEGLREEALLFSSPMLRCRQTAEVLREVLGLTGDITIVEEFTETDYGEFEGKHPQQIKAEYPELYPVWINTPSQVVFPGGESFRQVRSRSVTTLFELIGEYPKKALFVVTHVDVIKMIVSHILSIPIDSKHYFRVDTGSFTCLEVEGQEIRVRYINCA